MPANYSFTVNALKPARTNPALGNGTISTANIVAAAYAPHSTTAANDLLLLLNTAAGTNTARLVRRGSGEFAADGVLGTDYYDLSSTNSGIAAGVNNAILFDKHPTTTALDLMIIQQSSGTNANNLLSFLTRGAGATPFPGAATNDVTNRYQTNNTNLGGSANNRQMTIAYHPSDRTQDALVIPNNGPTVATRLLFRGSTSTNFPGAAATGAERIDLSKTNSAGGSKAYGGSCFIKHPTDSTKDLIAFSNSTDNTIDLVLRGSTGTPFPGGTLGTNRYVISQATGAFLSPARLRINLHPTNPARDLLAVCNSANNTISLLFRGTNEAAPFTELLMVFGAAEGFTTLASASFAPAAARADDLMIVVDSGTAKANFYRPWSLSAQPASPALFTNIVTPESPVFLNSSNVTIDASVDFYSLDRRINGLSTKIPLSWSWTRSTETEATLGTNLIFSGGTAAITGQYRLTMGASTTLTLGSRTSYDEKITVPSTGTLVIAGNVSLASDFILSAGTTVNKTGAGPYTLTIPYPDPGLVLGSGVVLDAPTNEIVISGLPVVANTILAVINLTTNAISYPTLVGGGATIELDPDTNYLFAADAPGYLRQAVTLPGNTPTFAFDLTDYRALYESGVSLADYVAFDYSTLAVTVTYNAGVTYSFANMYRTIEDYLATPQGVLFPNPPSPIVVDVGGGNGRQYFFFPYDDDADMVNPVRVKAHASNLVQPTFTDFVVILEGADAPLFDIFDFSNGKVIRFQTEAVAATVSGGGGGGGDVTAIAGNTAAATELAAALTGSGKIRANAVQVAGQTTLAPGPVDFGNLGTIAEGVPRSSSATAQVVTAGTVISGGFATTAADDGSYFSVAPGATGLNVYLEFEIGSQFPMGVTINGRYNAIIMNRFCNVFAWNWLTSAWEQISDSVTRMNNSNSDANYSYPLLARHREGSGTVGRVRISFQSADTLNTIRLELDQVLVKSVNAAITAAEIAAAVYARLVIEAYRRDHGIVVDTVNGAAGTVTGDNGIAQNPSSNLVDAFAIATAMKAKQLFVAGGSSLTINQAYSGWAFLSQNGSSLWSVNLNGQLLTASVFVAARVSGTGLSTSERIRFEGCVFDAATLGNSIAQASVLGATSSITAISGADISLRSCYTVNVTTLPAINFASPAATTRIRVQDHKGSVRVQNMNANSTLWFSADGQLVIEASCTAGQIFVESTAAVLNNGTATVTRLNVLADLTATLQAPGVFSTAALANAPTGSGGGGGLDAAGVRAAIGLAAANLDTQLGAIDDFLDTEVAAIKAKTDLLNFTGTDVKATLDGETVIVGDKTGFSLAGSVTVGSIANNAITSASIATSARQVFADSQLLGVTGGTTAIFNASISSALGYLGFVANGINDNISGIPTNPLLTTDPRLNNLDATISSRSTFDPTTTNVTVGGYASGQSPSVLVDLSAIATTAQVNTARDAIITQGNTAWVTATGFSTLTGSDIASVLTNYQVAKVSDVQVEVLPTPVTVNGGFTPDNAADLAAAKDAAIAAQSAAEAVADGRHAINYVTSAATQYNPDGSERTVFDLLDADGNPATTAATAVERVPQ